MTNETKETPKVVVSLSSAYLTNRQILSGILKYIRLRAPCNGTFLTGRADEPALETVLTPETDAIITDGLTPEETRLVEELDIPAVTVLQDKGPSTTVAKIGADAERLGRLAADHFIGNGFTSFAYVEDLARSAWSKDRCATFKAALAEKGFTCAVYNVTSKGREKPKDDRARLGNWLAGLPYPCAVFAANDVRARIVLEVCRARGILVPAQIALLGVDNDEMLCETALPPITSIGWDTVDCGFRAAEYLDGILRSGVRPETPKTFLYSGNRLFARTSSMLNATGDPLVDSCREYIAANLSLRLSTDRVASALGTPRRTLERRFLLGAGHSVRAEIQSARLTLARRLLDETDYRLEDIAFKCGFYDVSHMRQSFSRFGLHLAARKETLEKEERPR